MAIHYDSKIANINNEKNASIQLRRNIISKVNAVVIGDIINRTVVKFHWNQNVFTFWNRGATAIMHMEIWQSFLMARDAAFRTKDEKPRESHLNSSRTDK